MTAVNPNPSWYQYGDDLVICVDDMRDLVEFCIAFLVSLSMFTVALPSKSSK